MLYKELTDLKITEILSFLNNTINFVNNLSKYDKTMKLLEVDF